MVPDYRREGVVPWRLSERGGSYGRRRAQTMGAMFAGSVF